MYIISPEFRGDLMCFHSPPQGRIFFMGKFQITITRPAGNDQLLIKDLVTKEQKRFINDEMIRRFPNVEQVSFYEDDPEKNTAQLELAGGEFCGNATRSLAYLLLEGKKGSIYIKTSGTKQILQCGIKKENTAFAQMPIFPELNSVRKIDKNLFRVDLEGIIHLIYDKPTGMKTESQLKEFTRSILEKENLLYSSPAAGVMFVEDKENEMVLKPVVWVRDIETLLYETACASGTTAVGLWLTRKRNTNALYQKIKQPTGKYIYVSIEKNEKTFLSAFIDGPIEILQKGFVEI